MGIRGVINSLTTEAPIAIGWDGRPVGRVFDDWEWLPTGLGLRLHLAPGIRFHDGTPLTSSIAAEILRVTFFEEKRRTISSTVTSIEPAGESFVVITTERREGFLISDIASANFSLPGKPRVGTGPFQFVSGTSPIVLHAFDGYRLGRPAIDEVSIVEYPTQRAAWAAMMRKEIDLLYEVSREAVEFVEAQSTLDTYSFLRPYYYALAFNVRQPLFAGAQVRRALNEAIDRKQIVVRAMRNRGQPAGDPIWPFHWAYALPERGYTYNPQAASLRLDNANLKENRERRPGHMPSRFHFRCVVVAEDQTAQRIALVVQKQLYDVAVEMEVELVPLAALGERMQRGDFDATLLEFNSSKSLHYIYMFWHSPQPHVPALLNSGYEAADEALDRFRGATSAEEIRAAVADVQRALYDNPPAVFLAWTDRARALSRQFVAPDQGEYDIVNTIHQWRPAESQLEARR